MTAVATLATVAVVAVGRPTFDLDLGAERVAAALHALRDHAVVGDGAIATDLAGVDAAIDAWPEGASDDEPAVIVVLQATFSDSTLVARVAERTTAPLLVWSFPEPRTGGRLRLNSLCGANLAAFRLRLDARSARFVYADPTAAGIEATIAEALREARRSRAERADGAGSTAIPTPIATPIGGHAVPVSLRGARIGVIGDAPTGFEPCEADADELLRVTGLTLERVELQELFDAADRLPTATVDEHRARARRTLDVTADVASQGLTESMALYGGLRDLASAHGWSALATRCWPECMTAYGGAACTPMAMLTEDGVPSVCEADVHGAVTALVLREIAGSDPFVADLVDADPVDGTSAVWHCGVASVSLADPRDRPIGITHPNRHRALASQFALRPGRVTVARLSRAGGRSALVIGTGELLDRPRPFSGTCGVLRWDRPVDDVLATVFGRGLEHHLALVHGDHREALVAVAAGWGLPVVELGVAT